MKKERIVITVHLAADDPTGLLEEHLNDGWDIISTTACHVSSASVYAVHGQVIYVLEREKQS